MLTRFILLTPNVGGNGWTTAVPSPGAAPQYYPVITELACAQTKHTEELKPCNLKAPAGLPWCVRFRAGLAGWSPNRG